MKKNKTRKKVIEPKYEVANEIMHNYPVMGTWFRRIVYVMEHTGRGLTLREIADWIVSFEPGLTKDKTIESIRGIICGTINQRKVRFEFDRSNGNKTTRYSLHGQNHNDKNSEIPPIYPVKGTWPKKLEFIMNRERRKLTVIEIVKYILEMQQELKNKMKYLTSVISHAIANREDLFCKEESSEVRTNLYYLRNCSLIDESQKPNVYPIRATWLNKIIYILNSENCKLTQKELAKIILRYEPRMNKMVKSLPSQISEIFNDNPKLFSHDKQIGPGARYWLRDQNFSDSENSTYPINATWTRKVYFVLKQNGQKLFHSEIIDLLLRHEPCFNNNRRYVSSNVVGALKRDIFCRDKSLGQAKTKFFICEEPSSN